MSDARYFLPDHPDLSGDYSRDDLRLLLHTGKLSRSDMVFDDRTGLAHLLGALLASPYHLSPVRRKPLPVEEVKEEDEEEQEETSVEEPEEQRDHLEVDGRDQTVESSDEEDIFDEPEREPEEDEPERPRERNHTEFRATTPLRSQDLPSPQIDYHPGDKHEEDDDEFYDDVGDGRGDEEEEDDERHLIHQDSADHASAIVRDPPKEEELLLHAHPAWLSYRKSLLGFLALASASILVQKYHLGLTWCVTTAALAMLCLAFVALHRMATEYYLTSRRVEVISGLLGRCSKEIRIADIRAIDVTQSWSNAFFAVGTVDFFSSAGDEADVCFENISRPHRLKDMVRGLQG